MTSLVDKVLRLIGIVLLILAPFAAHGANTATVTVNLADVFNGGLQANAQVCFSLKNYSGNVPRVVGTNVILQDLSSPWCKSPDNTGLISTTLVGNDVIVPNTCTPIAACTYYAVEYWLNGQSQFGANYQFTSNVTYNLATATPLVPGSGAPVIVPPTGDSTYARLDNGNTSAWDAILRSLNVTGASTLTGSVTATTGVTTKNINNVLWVGTGAGQYSSLAACLTALPVAVYAVCSDAIGTCWQSGGGACHVSPGWTETLAANLVLQTDKSIYFEGPATINQGVFQVTAADGVSGVSIIALTPDHGSRTSGVTFNYTGNSDQFQLGAGGSGVGSFYLSGLQIHAIGGGNAATPLHVNSASYSTFIDLDLVCSANAGNTGNGLLLQGGAGGSNQNIFSGTTINFCNTAEVISADQNIFMRELLGNPKTNGSPAYSVTGSRNTFINDTFLTGTFSSGYNFSSTATGNEIIGYHSGVLTKDVIFGASTVDNVFHCPSGPCSETDNSAATANNSVIDSSTWGQTAAGDLRIRRIKPQTGSAVVAGDFVLSGGWGATSTVSTALGTDSAGVIIITTSGGGEGANPTVTFTYHDGTWGTNTIPLFERGPDLNAPLNIGLGCTTGPTTPVCTFAGTPVDAKTYQFNYHVFGRP